MAKSQKTKISFLDVWTFRWRTWAGGELVYGLPPGRAAVDLVRRRPTGASNTRYNYLIAEEKCYSKC